MVWDVFISHATEDKENLVEPLTTELKKYGAKVWYDIFELKLGDSLSKSIDEGLANSNYGLVVISEAFLSKNWPDYELRSLISKEVSYGKTILPIWHNITKDRLLKYSPFLADKMALSSEIGVNELALKIIEVVRPDIINSFMLKEASRKMRKSSVHKAVDINKINPGPVMHKSVPLYLIYLSMIFSQVFFDLIGMTYQEVISNFASDWDYDKEVIVWTAITLAFLEFNNKNNISNNTDKKKAALEALLMISMGNFDESKTELSHVEYNQINEIYYYHIKEIKMLSELNS